MNSSVDGSSRGGTEAARIDQLASPKSGNAALNAGSGAGVERALAIALLLAIPVVAPWCNLQLSGRWAPLFLLCVGVLLCWFLLARVVVPVGAWLVQSSGGLRLRTLLCAGVIVQLLVGILTAPIPVSDFAHYLYLASQLVAGAPYVDEMGRIAMWPPGLPFALTPFVALFGPTLAAIVTLNAVLYLGGAWAVWSLASRLAGRKGALLATLLFTIWPARLLMAGLAAKENVLIPAVAIGIALCFEAFDRSARRPVIIALCAGIAFGVATLTQPGVLPLVAAIPVCYRFVVGELGVRRFIGRLGLVIAGATIVVSPWVVRNCLVFDGAFCGVSTNGGSVFYRANNPSASGTYMREPGTVLEGLPEVDKDRRGYELGRQWIAAHPLDAAMLSMRKVTMYLGGDAHGAYWSLFRATGGTEEHAFRTATAARTLAYSFGGGLSLIYWVLLAAFCVQAIWRWPVESPRTARALLPLVYPLLSGAVVYGLFESGDRQHMFAVGPLIVLAAVGIAQREAAPRAGAHAARA